MAVLVEWCNGLPPGASVPYPREYWMVSSTVYHRALLVSVHHRYSESGIVSTCTYRADDVTRKGGSR